MKRVLSYLVVAMIIINSMLGMITVNAATTKGTTVAQPISNLNVGNNVTAKFTFTASKIAYISATVTYDSSVLEFDESKSSSSRGSVYFNPGSAGKLLFSISDTGSSSITLTLSFKAKSAGQSYLGIQNGDFGECTDFNENEIIFTGAGQTVKISDKSASKSSDANLKYITPSAGSLTPKFSASVTTYSITIPNSVKTLTVGAGTSHSGAEWDVEGSKDMKVGSNKRVIVVTAEDGTEKRYTLNITRLAADGTTPEPDVPDTENPTDEKTSVTADGQDKYIANEFDTQNLFPGYAVDVFRYNDKEFPCIKKDDSVLVYLTDIDGANGAFYRPLEDGSFTVFTFMMSESKFYEFLTPDEIPEGYSEITMDIAGYKVTAYQSIDPTLSEFALIYAKGPDGNTGFYRYDTVEHTLQRVVDLNASQPPTDTDGDKKDGTIWENIMSMDTSTKVVAITIVGVILLLIVAIIVLIVKIVKASRYEEELEYEQDMVVEEDDTSDFEFISISDRDSYDEE